MAMDRPTYTNVCEATSQSHDLDNLRPIHRKGKKLLAEKKRRARINNCLIQIRDLVCEGDEEKDSDIDKMEKAEILEKTLEVLTRLRRDYNTVNLSGCNMSAGLHSSPSARRVMAVRYASGFSSCAEESIRYIQNSRLVPAEVKAQLQNHLRCIARRMETGVADVETVAPMRSHFPVHPYSSSSAAMPRVMDSMVPGTGDVVSSSVLTEVEPATPYRIPSPIHSSTPVTSQAYQQEVENIGRRQPPAATMDNTTVSQASRRYECITPEIDVVEESSAGCAAGSSTVSPDSHRAQQLIHPHQLPSTPEITLSHSLDHSVSPAFPITSTLTQPVHQQPFPAYSSGHQRHSTLHPPHPSSSSSPLVSHIVIPQPQKAYMSTSHSPATSVSPLSSSQTMYTYRGYEPYLTTTNTTTTSIETLTPPHFHPCTATTAATVAGSINSISNTQPRPAAEVKSQVTPSTPALDLCVKRHSHQISPETMWRPW